MVPVVLVRSRYRGVVGEISLVMGGNLSLQVRPLVKVGSGQSRLRLTGVG